MGVRVGSVASGAIEVALLSMRSLFLRLRDLSSRPDPAGGFSCRSVDATEKRKRSRYSDLAFYGVTVSTKSLASIAFAWLPMGSDSANCDGELPNKTRPRHAFGKHSGNAALFSRRPRKM